MSRSPAVREASREEGRALFDRRARKLFGISGVEWLERYDRGDYRFSANPNVTTMVILIPFAWPVRSRS